MILQQSSWHSWPIPSQLSVARSAEWSETPCPDRRYRAQACSFDLPLHSDSLFTLSRGPFCAGTLRILQKEAAGDTVTVSVTVQYLDRYVLENYVKVCLVKASDTQHGVGIFTRRERHQSNDDIHLRFDMVIKLPKPPLLHVKSLESDMPHFVHNVGDLAHTVIFDYISLRTANVPIEVTSLRAISGKIETANSRIEGNFNASSLLALLTTNAPIRAHVVLKSDFGPSELLLTTANGPIEGTIELSSPDQSRGDFRITANSALAGVNLDLKSAPEDSVIHVAARTAMAPATVRMPRTYEGSFLVTTSMGEASVTPESPTDPSGRGRHRSVDLNGTSYGSVHGTVSWSNTGKTRGSVEVSSSMASVNLLL